MGTSAVTEDRCIVCIAAPSWRCDASPPVGAAENAAAVQRSIELASGRYRALGALVFPQATFDDLRLALRLSGEVVLIAHCASQAFVETDLLDAERFMVLLERLPPQYARLIRAFVQRRERRGLFQRPRPAPATRSSIVAGLNMMLDSPRNVSSPPTFATPRASRRLLSRLLIEELFPGCFKEGTPIDLRDASHPIGRIADLAADERRFLDLLLCDSLHLQEVLRRRYERAGTSRLRRQFGLHDRITLDEALRIAERTLEIARKRGSAYREARPWAQLSIADEYTRSS